MFFMEIFFRKLAKILDFYPLGTMVHPRLEIVKKKKKSRILFCIIGSYLLDVNAYALILKHFVCVCAAVGRQGPPPRVGSQICSPPRDPKIL